MKSLDDEEDFHGRDKKEFRKVRKLAQTTDRSKFKKTDIDKQEIQEPSVQFHRGRILSIRGEGSYVDFEGKIYLCSLKGFLKKNKGKNKNLVAVGDWVRFSIQSPEEGTIHQVEKRYSFLSRTDISGRQEQLIAVNIDQVMITACLISPPFKPALIDRYLIAAEKGGLRPVILINKIDLLETASVEEKAFYQEFLAAYEPLGYPILSVSVKSGIGLDALCSLLQHKTSVFAGQSGVGKSSLLNACFGFDLRIGDLTQKTFKGSHTTTTANLLGLPNGGYCVDTPGIRSFGIWSLKKEEIFSHFQDLAEQAQRCKYPNCMHINEPKCAVLQALENQELSPLRYESYRTLMSEVDSQERTTWS